MNRRRLLFATPGMLRSMLLGLGFYLLASIVSAAGMLMQLAQRPVSMQTPTVSIAGPLSLAAYATLIFAFIRWSLANGKRMAVVWIILLPSAFEVLARWFDSAQPGIAFISGLGALFHLLAGCLTAWVPARKCAYMNYVIGFLSLTFGISWLVYRELFAEYTNITAYVAIGTALLSPVTAMVAGFVILMTRRKKAEIRC